MATLVNATLIPIANALAAACAVTASALVEVSAIAAATPANRRLSTVSRTVKALLGVKTGGDGVTMEEDHDASCESGACQTRRVRDILAKP